MPGKQVLLVDDDITLSEMYAERLKTAGYEVTVVHDGEQGLESAKAKPDIILLDIMMPKMNGLDVLKKLKADSELENIPVILLTALIQELDKVKGLKGGAVEYYVKSETMPRDLINRIDEILNGKKASGSDEEAKAEESEESAA